MVNRKNFTRYSASIPQRLVRERAFHLLPLYYVLTLSDLGREACEHSGSYRFADHVYRGIASGRGMLGRGLDALLLSMPAAGAFRRRCAEAKRAMRQTLETAVDGSLVRILAVPCGIPRDWLELHRALRTEYPGLLRNIDYRGMDIDPVVLELAGELATADGVAARFHCGDALTIADYPPGPFHCIVSTGFGEFVQDDELISFYRCVYGLLAPGGRFFTSATAREPVSARLLQLMEVEVHYRTAGQVRHALALQGWRHVSIRLDPTGLQSFFTAVK